MESSTKFLIGAAALAGAGVWVGTALGRRAEQQRMMLAAFQPGRVWYIGPKDKRTIVLDEPAIRHLRHTRFVAGVTSPVPQRPEWRLDWLLDNGKTSAVVLEPTPTPPGGRGRAYVVRLAGRQPAETERSLVFALEELELADRLVADR